MGMDETSAMPDGALVEAARQGRREAFDELVARHQATLRVQAARYLVSGDDVLDVVQDAFFSAYRHLERFETDRPFLPWLRQILRNRVLNLLRDRAVERSRPLAMVDAALAEAAQTAVHDDGDGGDGGEANGDGRELAAMRHCLDGLEAKARELLDRRHVQGMAVKDIAQAIGRSPGSVSMLLMRIRSTLSACVQRRLAPRGAL